MALNWDRYPDIRFPVCIGQLVSSDKSLPLPRTWCSPWQDVGANIALRPSLARPKSSGRRGASTSISGKMVLLHTEVPIRNHAFPLE